MTTSNGSVKRRDLFIAEARRDGTKTLQELADHYGLSRERVRQIANAQGVNGRQAAAVVMERRHEAVIEDAEANTERILMRYIAGDTPQTIAAFMELPINAIKSVLDESITDEIVAARSNFRAMRLYPEIDAGPRETAAPREDRWWTQERCWKALCDLARENGNMLMSSTAYQRISTGRTDLPSFKTVRDRLGRWSTVRVQVHSHLRSL